MSVLSQKSVTSLPGGASRTGPAPDFLLVGQMPNSLLVAPCGLLQGDVRWIPERGARLARRAEEAYRRYVTEAQRRRGGMPRPEGTLHLPDAGHHQPGAAPGSDAPHL